MIRQEKPNFVAQHTAPNPTEVSYWIDLTADPNGKVIKTHDGKEWNSITAGGGDDESLSNFYCYKVNGSVFTMTGNSAPFEYELREMFKGIPLKMLFEISSDKSRPRPTIILLSARNPWSQSNYVVPAYASCYSEKEADGTITNILEVRSVNRGRYNVPQNSVVKFKIKSFYENGEVKGILYLESEHAPVAGHDVNTFIVNNIFNPNVKDHETITQALGNLDLNAWFDALIQTGEVLKYSVLNKDAQGLVSPVAINFHYDGNYKKVTFTQLDLSYNAVHTCIIEILRASGEYKKTHSASYAILNSTTIPNIESVEQLPSDPDPTTLYIITA